MTEINWNLQLQDYISGGNVNNIIRIAMMEYKMERREMALK